VFHGCASVIGRHDLELRGKFAVMRLAILAVIAIGCGGHASSPEAPPAGAAGFPATRWVPDRPTYLFASPTVTDALHSLRDTIDVLGTVTGYDLRAMTRAIEPLIVDDAAHPDPLAAVGVDLHGSWAMFSDELNPTVVIHLTAPGEMAGFLDRRRARGLATHSVIVDKIEVVSGAAPVGGVTLRWAIDGDWMWIHLALPFSHEDGTSWFQASHGPHGDGWTGNWLWAQRAAGARAETIDSGPQPDKDRNHLAPRVSPGESAATAVGFLDMHGAIAGVIARIPDALACARLIEPVGRVAVAVEADRHHMAARIALDVGSTAGIRSMILPPPSGWDATATHAAIAAQWNLDLAAARSWLAPCLALAGGRLALPDEPSVRTARGMLLGFDPDAMSGSGAVALDLASPAFFERQLDRIPLRRALERARTFGPYKGFSIAIPFSVTVEYVLDHKLALAALGEGLLARLVAPGRGTPPPIFALDVAPPVMSAEAWEAVLHMVTEQSLSGSPGPATKHAVERLMQWRDAHLAVTADATALIFTVSGNRR
jgi:hypothetical protein